MYKQDINLQLLQAENSHCLLFLHDSLQVKEATETERAQRITVEKKHDVHEELLRKAVLKEVGIRVTAHA